MELEANLATFEEEVIVASTMPAKPGAADRRAAGLGFIRVKVTLAPLAAERQRRYVDRRKMCRDVKSANGA